MTQRVSMPSIDLRSVFVKCGLLMALATLVVAGGTAFNAVRMVEQMATETTINQVERLAPPYANALVSPLRFSVAEKIEQTVAEALTAADSAGLAALAIGADGAVLAAAGDETVSEALAEVARESLASGAEARGEGGLWLATPVRPGAEAEPLGVLAVAMSDRVAKAAVFDAEVTIAVVAVSLFLLMLAGTLFALSRFLGRPLNMLRDTVDRIKQGDYDTEVALTGRKDELGAVARDLEEMVDVLRQGRTADEARKRQHEAQVRVVGSLGEGLDALASGVLTRRLAESFPEEYEALRANFNRAVDSLHEAIGAVAGNAESISRNAADIAGASDELSGRTETQAATLEQSAAALEELLASVNSAAQNAEEADKAVGQARAKAAHNDEIMRAAMSAMGEIEKSADQIADIITVIDDIAFQTNLLALNAGVEAARAGESGKGFAVVASEVRTLAQRSSEAAHQIKDLILGSNEQVKKGAQLVEEAGVALGDVVSQIGEISDLMSGIANGAVEQSQGLKEINVGVADLDKVTQQNAAMVQHSTAAAHVLRTEAGRMTELVGKFEIDRSTISEADRSEPAASDWDAEPQRTSQEERWQAM